MHGQNTNTDTLAHTLTHVTTHGHTLANTLTRDKQTLTTTIADVLRSNFDATAVEVQGLEAQISAKLAGRKSSAKRGEEISEVGVGGVGPGSLFEGDSFLTDTEAILRELDSQVTPKAQARLRTHTHARTRTQSWWGRVALALREELARHTHTHALRHILSDTRTHTHGIPPPLTLCLLPPCEQSSRIRTRLATLSTPR